MHTIRLYITSTVPNIFILGLAVVEVAHDFVPKIKNWLLQQNIQNSFDTWHGTKGVAKAMKEISSGAQKWEGQKWFSELSDKRKSLLNLVSIGLVHKMLLLSSQNFTTMAIRQWW